MKKVIFFFAFLASVFVFQSCLPEPGLEIPENLVVPEIPPAELMTMPTEKMAQEDPLIQNEERGGTKHNWVHAGVSLWVWHGVIVLNMITPVSAIGHAFNHNAEYIGDNTFEWAYAYTDPATSAQYDVSLTGQYINNNTQVEWKLTASEVGSFTDFVWVSGIVNVDVTESTFTLFKNPNNSEAYLQINSNRDAGFNNTTVRFTNVEAGDPGNGDFIEYKAMNNGLYNRGFQVSRDVRDVLDIEWNEPAGDGRVRHEERFNDTAWHCWDENQDDIDCD